MKVINKKHLTTKMVISILLIIPSIIGVIPNSNDVRRTWKNNLPSTYEHLNDIINATMGYEDCKNIYL